MTDLQSPRLLWIKGGLFLVGGTLAAGLLLLDRPTPKSAALLALAVWCFCRAYYFAFYVLERYVDRSFRYAGLWSLMRDLIKHGRRRQSEDGDEAK